ncbi:MAG TPA: tetratricopeptide repeat protein [Terriglobales bacterium]|nr:tetratricopeptide repeat protein [Terriglobales bacterium]
MESGSPRNVFRFGLFEADVARSTLTRNGVRVRIQDQPFRVLVRLLARAGEIVSRAELKQQLWPDGTHVDFDGSLNVILKKLRAAIDDDPDNPRFVETVPRHGYRFIAPVTVIDTAPVVSRPQIPIAAPTLSLPASNAPDASSGSIATPVEGLSPSVGKPEKTFHFSYAASVLAVVLALGAGWYAWHGKEAGGTAAAASTTSPVKMRRSVAVLGFNNLSGRSSDEWLSTALSEMLSTELAGGGKLRLVSGEDVANLRVSSPWTRTDTLDQATTARIGVALSSDMLVLGSYAALGEHERGQLRVDVRLQDAKTGEILTEIAEIGGPDDLFQIVSRIGEKLRDRLGVPRMELAEETGVLSSMPHDPGAARFYAMGLAKLRQFDASAAKDLLEQAITLDPKFALAHTMLARAWTDLGYEQKRRQEAARARELAGKLPQPERMLVDGDYFESLGNHDKAASVYHALFELYPDSIEYGLQLAYTESAGGHGSEAREVINRLRKLPAPASNDPRIDIAEARFSISKVDSLNLLRQAMKKAWSQGQTLVYARARREECMDLNYSQHPEQAEPSCKDAYQIYISAGNRLGAADSLRLLGDNSGTRGDFEAALGSYNRALQVLDGMGGEHEKTGAILNNMAIVLENQGKLDKSEELYRQANVHFQQAGDKVNVLTTLANLADNSYLRGNLAEAQKLYEQTLQASEKMDPNMPGYALYRGADLALTQGRVREAHKMVDEAIKSISQEQGNYQGLTGAMAVLGEVLEAEGNLDGARDEFEKTLAIQKKAGMTDLLDETQQELAELDLLQGHAEKAEPVLRSIIADFEKQHSDPDAISAYTLLSRILLAQGKIDDAAKAVQRASELNTGGANPALTLPLSIQRARVIAASPGRGAANSAAQARQELRSTVSTARKLGYYELEGEARLALAQLELRNTPVPTRAQMNSLILEARTRGFELLAHRAEQVLSQQQSNEVARNTPAQ